MKRKSILFFLLVGVLSLNAQEGKYSPVKLNQKGWIKGRVVHSNKTLEMPKLEVDRDAKICGSESRGIEAVDIGPDGALRNAVVYLQGITSGKQFVLPAKPPALMQERCNFTPHVQLVPAFSSIRITNTDQILHTVHAFQFGLGQKFVLYPNSISYPAKTLFNIAMVASRKETFQQLGDPGIVKVVCDAGHYWMTAYFVVMPHPYFAKVDSDGSYILEDVPPGKYTLVCWHEYFGTQEKEVVVKENQPASVDFLYTEEL